MDSGTSVSKGQEMEDCNKMHITFKDFVFRPVLLCLSGFIS